MKKNKQTHGKTEGIALLSMLLGGMGVSMLAAVLISKQILPEEMGSTISVMLTELMSFLFCYTVAGRFSKNRMLTALVMSGLFCCLRLLIGTIVFAENDLRFVRCAFTLLAGAAAGVMSNMKKQKRRRT